MEDPYKNREIDTLFQEIKAMFTEHREDDRKDFGEVKEAIAALTTQVKQTNGRVRALELWRMFVLGALAIIGWMVSPDIVQKVLSL